MSVIRVLSIGSHAGGPVGGARITPTGGGFLASCSGARPPSFFDDGDDVVIANSNGGPPLDDSPDNPYRPNPDSVLALLSRIESLE
jgi:hypothetical protein